MRKGGLKPAFGAWALATALLCSRAQTLEEGSVMDVDAVTNENQPGEIGRHARDYSRFIAMFKWGAIFSFITAIVVMMIIA